MKESGSIEEEPSRKRQRCSDTGTSIESDPRMSNSTLMDRLICNHQCLKHTRSLHERMVNKNLRLRRMPDAIEDNMQPLALLGPMSVGLSDFQIHETNHFLKVTDSEKAQFINWYDDLHWNFDYNVTFLIFLVHSMKRDMDHVDDASRDDLEALIDVTDRVLVEMEGNQWLIKQAHGAFLENYDSIESDMKALMTAMKDDVNFTRRNALYRLASSQFDLVDELIKSVEPWTTLCNSLKSIFETINEVLREYIFIINGDDETTSIEAMMNKHVTFNKDLVQKAKRDYIAEYCWDDRPRIDFPS